MEKRIRGGSIRLCGINTDRGRGNRKKEEGSMIVLLSDLSKGGGRGMWCGCGHGYTREMLWGGSELGWREVDI